MIKKVGQPLSSADSTETSMPKDEKEIKPVNKKCGKLKGDKSGFIKKFKTEVYEVELPLDGGDGIYSDKTRKTSNSKGVEESLIATSSVAKESSEDTYIKTTIEEVLYGHGNFDQAVINMLKNNCYFIDEKDNIHTLNEYLSKGVLQRHFNNIKNNIIRLAKALQYIYTSSPHSFNQLGNLEKVEGKRFKIYLFHGRSSQLGFAPGMYDASDNILYMPNMASDPRNPEKKKQDMCHELFHAIDDAKSVCTDEIDASSGKKTSSTSAWASRDTSRPLADKITQYRENLRNRFLSRKKAIKKEIEKKYPGKDSYEKKNLIYKELAKEFWFIHDPGPGKDPVVPFQEYVEINGVKENVPYLLNDNAEIIAYAYTVLAYGSSQQKNLLDQTILNLIEEWKKM